MNEETPSEANWFPVSLAACSWVAWRFQPGSIKWLFLISHVWASVHTLHETYQHIQTKMCNESQSKKQCSAQLHHPHWSKESRPCLQVADQTWKSFSFNKPIANCSSSNYHDSHSDGTFLTSTTSAAYSVHVVLVWNGQMVHVHVLLRTLKTPAFLTIEACWLWALVWMFKQPFQNRIPFLCTWVQ